MSNFLSWLVRYGHVLGAAVWTGDYAVLALIILPALQREPGEALRHLAVAMVQIATYAGTLVIVFGAVLIARTRGYNHLLGSTWGALVLASVVIAVVLLGVGDGALRPAIRNLAAGGDTRAVRRWSIVGLALTVLAMGLMTGAVYAG